ncbi:hypothetical protein Tco_1479624, partial [Tanacetum coccineum]
AYTDSDYAGASLDRKSTTGGCQFLGSRFISCKYKKQTIVANSTTEAEYVAASNCCGQVLLIQNQLLDYEYNFVNTKIFIDNKSTICIVKNLVFHLKTKHIEIRHHFIIDSNEKKLIQMVKIHTDQNVVDFLTKAFNLKWNATTAEDGIEVKTDNQLNPQHTPTTASPSHVEPIPTVASSSHPKKTHKHRKTKRNATEISQSSRPTTLVADETVHEERGDNVKRAATTAANLDAERDSGNILRTQSTVTLNKPIA